MFSMSHLTKAIILGFLTGITGLIIGFSPFGTDLEENKGLDLLFKIRGERQAPTDAVVISIDRESSEYLNLPDNPDKWPRSIHARLTENLVREGAKVIIFDLHFIEPRSPEGDNLFAEAILKAKNIVLCEPLKAKEISSVNSDNSNAAGLSIVKIVEPLPLLSHPAIATAPFPLPRIPFKVNKYWIFQTGAGDSPTLPVVAFQLFTIQSYKEFINLLEKVSPHQAGRLPHDIDTALKTKCLKELMKAIKEIFESEPSISEKMLKELKSSETSSEDTKKNQLIKSLIKIYQGPNYRYINYYGPPRTVTTIPYYQALQIHNGVFGNKQIDLKGKAVFVGLSEIMLADRKDSFYTVFSQADGIFISGVEIAATAFSNLIEDASIRPLRLPFYILTIFSWGIIIGIVSRMLPLVFAALSIVGLSIFYLLFACYQFETVYSWFPIVTPLFLQNPLAFFSAVIWKYIESNKERQIIRKAFEYYLPKNIVDQLAKNLGHIKTGGEVVYGVCLSTDAEQYTSLSEKMNPEELGNFMNRYYGTVFKPVKQHGGLVSDVIGDSMLAVWIGKGPEDKISEKACLAALDIKRDLEQFNKLSDTVKLGTRIGLHSGHILLGHIGALDHFEYRPVGDIVNTSTRIEGLNKYLGTRLLVSEEVISQLEGFLTRKLGEFILLGKTKPITIYELVCRIEDSEEKQRRGCEIFADALNAYRRQSWYEAIEKFNKCREEFKEDGPSLFYINLCEQYKKNPPAEPWNGVVYMDKK